MGVLLLLTAAGGTVVAAYAGKRAGVSCLRTRLGRIVSTLGPKFLGGSKINLVALDVKIGTEVRVGVSGLKIGNLEPFKSDHLIEIQEASVAVNLSRTVRSAVKARGKPREVEVTSVLVQGCSVTLEKQSLGSSNVKALLQKLDEGKEPEERKRRSPSKRALGTQTQVRLGHVLISGVKIRVVSAVCSNAVGLGGSSGAGIVLTVPEIELKDFSESLGRLDLVGSLKQLLLLIFSRSLSAANELEHLGGLALNVASSMGNAGLQVLQNAQNSAIQAGTVAITTAVQLGDAAFDGAAQLGDAALGSAVALGDAALNHAGRAMALAKGAGKALVGPGHGEELALLRLEVGQLREEVQALKRGEPGRPLVVGVETVEVDEEEHGECCWHCQSGTRRRKPGANAACPSAQCSDNEGHFERPLPALRV